LYSWGGRDAWWQKWGNFDEKDHTKMSCDHVGGTIAEYEGKWGPSTSKRKNVCTWESAPKLLPAGSYSHIDAKFLAKDNGYTEDHDHATLYIRFCKNYKPSFNHYIPEVRRRQYGRHSACGCQQYNRCWYKSGWRWRYGSNSRCGCRMNRACYQNVLISPARWHFHPKEISQCNTWRGMKRVHGGGETQRHWRTFDGDREVKKSEWEGYKYFQTQLKIKIDARWNWGKDWSSHDAMHIDHLTVQGVCQDNHNF
jgi:hypothetical protein